MRQLKILVACGSGIATSSVAVYKIEHLCKEIGIDAKIVKSTIKEIPEKSAGMDLVLTTNRYQGIAECPVECVVNLLTGINAETTEKKVADILRQLAEG